MSKQLNLLTKQQLTATVLRLNREIKCLNTELLRYKIIYNGFERFFNVLQQTRYFDDFTLIHPIEANLFREQLINFKQLKSFEIKLNVLENSVSPNYIDNDDAILPSDDAPNAPISTITNNNGSNSMYIYSIDLNTVSRNDYESIDKSNYLETNEQSDTELSDLHENFDDYLDTTDDEYSTNSDSISGDDSNSDTNKKCNSKTKRKKRDTESNEAKQFICDWIGCEKSYANSGSLRNHKQVHRRSVEKRHKCDFDACNFATNSNKNLKRHKLTHSSEKAYMCDYEGCGVSIKEQRALYYHKVRAHPDIFPQLILLKCDFEGCMFTSKLERDYDRHVKKHAKLFKCGICFEKFNDINQLNDHTNTHTDDPQYICQFADCGKSFRLEKFLKIHSATHSEKTIACNWEKCGKMFSSQHYLKKHIYKVHKTPRTQYQCDFENCGKKFKRSDKLNAHRNIHTSDKLFACDWPGCDKRFVCQNYLTVHQRYHVKTGNDKLYQCSWPECKYSTNNKSNLNKHIDVHNGLKKHMCDWPGCEFSAANKSNLNLHKKLHVTMK